jgi:hypothetical protein
MVETFDCGATKPFGIGPAAHRGSLHHATEQPLFQALKNPDPVPTRFLNRFLSQAASRALEISSQELRCRLS